MFAEPVKGACTPLTPDGYPDRNPTRPCCSQWHRYCTPTAAQALSKHWHRYCTSAPPLGVQGTRASATQTLLFPAELRMRAPAMPPAAGHLHLTLAHSQLAHSQLAHSQLGHSQLAHSQLAHPPLDHSQRESTSRVQPHPHAQSVASSIRINHIEGGREPAIWINHECPCPCGGCCGRDKAQRHAQDATYCACCAKCFTMAPPPMALLTSMSTAPASDIGLPLVCAQQECLLL